MTMRRAWWLALAVTAALIAVLWLRTQIRIDSCLDSGGAWDYANGRCDGQ